MLLLRSGMYQFIHELGCANFVNSSCEVAYAQVIPAVHPSREKTVSHNYWLVIIFTALGCFIEVCIELLL